MSACWQVSRETSELGLLVVGPVRVGAADWLGSLRDPLDSDPLDSGVDPTGDVVVHAPTTKTVTTDNARLIHLVIATHLR